MTPADYYTMCETLWRFGLITEEQLVEEAERYQSEWQKGWSDAEWWWAMAEIAEQQYRNWWGKTFGLHYLWQRDWMDAAGA